LDDLPFPTDRELQTYFNVGDLACAALAAYAHAKYAKRKCPMIFVDKI
jgi:hypothetical protein